jgi:hypothetical protein
MDAIERDFLHGHLSDRSFPKEEKGLGTCCEEWRDRCAKTSEVHRELHDLHPIGELDPPRDLPGAIFRPPAEGCEAGEVGIRDHSEAVHRRATTDS